LNELTGNRYQTLETVFTAIERKIDAILKQRQAPTISELVLPLTAVRREMADGVGSKMANLGEITGELPGIAVPLGFAITAAAYERFLSYNQLTDEINRRLQSMAEEEISDLYRKSSEIQMLIIGADLPPELGEAISRAYEELARAAGGGAVQVALRSSAIGEDAADTSFAGQYHSELNVSGENLHAVYKEVVASKYALTAVSYRLHKGLRDEDVAMCVGCMVMVDSVCGGVMYSRDPTDLRGDAIFLNAVHGLAKSVVDGTVTPDLWVISRKEPLTVLKREIRDKELKAVCLPEEGVRLTSDARGTEPALTDDQALELARIALILEYHFQGPQDIEWCIDGQGRIFILQSRPLKQMAAPRSEGLEARAGQHPILLQGGELASSGVATGPVYVVQNNLDVLQFPAGAVLVTAFPHPGWAPLLSRAAALVTDRGGITGHLANVSREFGIPALFNTGKATSILTPGRLVTVDADGLAVYEGRVEELLALAGPKEGLMAGTPVGETLQEVMTWITPLHLTNPEAPDFKPQGCRTLHDITRFAHEVSVKEMFAFDKKQMFSRYFIKKLVTPVALEWWVLNLEDGFKEEVTEPQVELSNIASEPMLALWEGITAAPWEGPPPVDTRGFMSIVMGAATDPNLATAGGTIFGNQNYFMISRDFCNLTSRLGFHFSTVETLVGDRAFENYIRFAFKGGAADYPRRIMRTKFVGEILERYHFKVDVKEDALFARLEAEAKDYMLSRLRILGYLTIHTRQLDMIMLNEADVQYYAEKFIRDLEKLAAIRESD
jgi:pyruvate,water dikinase